MDKFDDQWAAMGAHSRLLRCNKSVAFFEKMTTGTQQGWPDISGDDFLSALADATNQWLGKRADGWQARIKLNQYLSDADAPNRIQPADLTPRKALTYAEISDHVKSAMRQEFAIFLETLSRDSSDGMPHLEGDQMTRLIADCVWVYGNRRGNGEAHLLTMRLYLSDDKIVV